MLMPGGVEARPDRAVLHPHDFQGNDPSKTVVEKADERRFYLAFNQTPAVGKARKRRAGKPSDPASSTPAEVRHDNPPKELSWGSFPLDPMIPQR